MSEKQKAAEFAKARHRALHIKTYGLNPQGIPYCNKLEGDFGSWADWERELKKAFLAGVAWRDKHPQKNDTDLFLKIATSGSRFAMSTPAVEFEKKKGGSQK
jgi:hypothetical protein